VTLGDLIAQYRARHDLSMDKFAELSGISKGYISMLERNQTQRGEEPSPSFGMYKSVAKTIGIDVDELIRMVEGKISLGRTDNRVAVSDDDIKFALFGETPDEVTDEMYEDVKNFARYIQNQKRNKRGDNKDGAS
jgi:Predicted transcriptional regulators